MTNAELNRMRLTLRDKREKIEGAMHPMAVMGDIKAAAVMGAQIADELARRELQRSWKKEVSE